MWEWVGFGGSLDAVIEFLRGQLYIILVFPVLSFLSYGLYGDPDMF
jgi:hypothetical protein